MREMVERHPKFTGRTVGSVWRIKADAPRGGYDSFEVYSSDCLSPPQPHVQKLAIRYEFDELTIDHWLHLERMDTRVWWLQIGDDMVMITIDRDGKPRMGEWYK